MNVIQGANKCRFKYLRCSRFICCDRQFTYQKPCNRLPCHKLCSCPGTPRGSARDAASSICDREYLRTLGETYPRECVITTFASFHMRWAGHSSAYYERFDFCPLRSIEMLHVVTCSANIRNMRLQGFLRVAPSSDICELNLFRHFSQRVIVGTKSLTVSNSSHGR